MASKCKSLKILLGQCVPSVKENASKIRIRKMELDRNLFMVRILKTGIIIRQASIYFIIDISVLQYGYTCIRS